MAANDGFDDGDEPQATHVVIDMVKVPAKAENWRAKKRVSGVKEICSMGESPEGLRYVEFPISDFSIATLRDRWGEGEFWVTFTRPAESGGVQLCGNTAPLIVGPRPEHDPIVRALGPAPLPPPLPPPSQAPPMQAAPPPVTRVVACAICNGTMPENAKFCPGCGTARGVVGAGHVSAAAGMSEAAVVAMQMISMFQSGQANALQMMATIGARATAEMQAATERYRIDAQEARARDQAFYDNLRRVDAAAPLPPAIDVGSIADQVARRVREDLSEDLDELQEAMSEEIDTKVQRKGEATTAETVSAIGKAVADVGLPIVTAIGDMVKNGGNNPASGAAA